MGEFSIVHLLMVLGILFFIMLIGREIACWYWKINKSIYLMEEMLAELKEANGKIRQK